MNKKRTMEEEKEEFAEKHNNPSHLYLDTRNKNIISSKKSYTIQFYIIIIVIFFFYFIIFSSHQIKII